MTGVSSLPDSLDSEQQLGSLAQSAMRNGQEPHAGAPQANDAGEVTSSEDENAPDHTYVTELRIEGGKVQSGRDHARCARSL